MARSARKYWATEYKGDLCYWYTENEDEEMWLENQYMDDADMSKSMTRVSRREAEHDLARMDYGRPYVNWWNTVVPVAEYWRIYNEGKSLYEAKWHFMNGEPKKYYLDGRIWERKEGV